MGAADHDGPVQTHCFLLLQIFLLSLCITSKSNDILDWSNIKTFIVCCRLGAAKCPPTHQRKALTPGEEDSQIISAKTVCMNCNCMNSVVVKTACHVSTFVIFIECFSHC